MIYDNAHVSLSPIPDCLSMGIDDSSRVPSAEPQSIFISSLFDFLPGIVNLAERNSPNEKFNFSRF